MQVSFLSKAVQAHYSVLNSAISAGKKTGLFKSPDLTVDRSYVVVSDCAGLFGCGVSFSDTGYVNVAPPTIGASAAQYTLIWQLDTGLYAKPELTWVSGLHEPGYDDYAVVVGWLFYSGSSLTLSTSMLVSSPVASELRVIKSIDSFSINAALSTVAGADAKVIKNQMWSSMTSTSPIRKTFSLTYEVQSDSSGVSCIALDVALSSQAFVRTWLIKDGESPVLIPGGQINGKVEASTQLLPLTHTRISPWERFQVQFDFVLAPGSSLDIGSIAFTNEPIVSQRTR